MGLEDILRRIKKRKPSSIDRIEKIIHQIKISDGDIRKVLIEGIGLDDELKKSIKSVFSLDDPDSLDTYVEIIETFFKTEKKNANPKKTEKQLFDQFSLTKAIFLQTPAYLTTLKNPPSKETYINLIESTDDPELKMVLSGFLPSYIHILQTKKFRKAFSEIIKKASYAKKCLETPEPAGILPDMSWSEDIDTFFRIVETPPHGFFKLSDHVHKSLFRSYYRAFRDKLMNPENSEEQEEIDRNSQTKHPLSLPAFIEDPKQIIAIGLTNIESFAEKSLLNRYTEQCIREIRQRKSLFTIENFFRPNQAQNFPEDSKLPKISIIDEFADCQVLQYLHKEIIENPEVDLIKKYHLVYYLLKNAKVFQEPSNFEVYAKTIQQSNILLGKEWTILAPKVLERLPFLKDKGDTYFSVLEEGCALLKRNDIKNEQKTLATLAYTLLEHFESISKPKNKDACFSALAELAPLLTDDHEHNLERLIRSIGKNIELLGAEDYIFKFKDVVKAAALNLDIKETSMLGNLIDSPADYIQHLRTPEQENKLIRLLTLTNNIFPFRFNQDILLKVLPRYLDVLSDREKMQTYVRTVSNHPSGNSPDYHTTILENLDFFADEENGFLFSQVLEQSTIIGNLTLEDMDSLLHNIELFKDPRLISEYYRFIEKYEYEFMGDTSSKFNSLLSGIIPYLKNLPPGECETFLKIINPHKYKGRTDSWLNTGLRCIELFKDHAKRYFDYTFKEGIMDSKIDELEAMNVLLDMPSAKDLKNNTISRRKITYIPSKDVETEAIDDTLQLLDFFAKIQQINKKNQNRKTRKKQIIYLKEKFPDFSPAIEELCRRGSDPLDYAEYADVFIASERMSESGTKKTLHASAMKKLGQELDQYLPQRILDESDGNGAKSPERDEYHPKIRRNIPEYLKRRLTKEFAQELLLEIENHRSFGGPQFETLVEYAQKTRTRLKKLDPFDEIRLEENAIFLDDLIDLIGACNSGEGKDREATLISKADRDAAGVPNQHTLSVNAYKDGKYVNCLGKALLVRTADKEDNTEKLLVEFVLVGPHLDSMRPRDNIWRVDKQEIKISSHGIAEMNSIKLLETDTGFDWRQFLFNGIIKYAQQEKFGSIIINTEHKEAGQRCLHEFVKYAVDQLNAHNYTATKYYRQVKGQIDRRLAEMGRSSDDQKMREQLWKEEWTKLPIEDATNKVWKKIEYSYKEKGRKNAFSLSGEKKNVSGFEYTHHLEKPDMDPAIVARIARSGWNGESYFDAWYRWTCHIRGIETGGQWNDGKGYITGIEIDPLLFELPERQ